MEPGKRVNGLSKVFDAQIALYFGHGRARICALRICGSPLFLLHDFVIRTSCFVIQNACTGWLCIFNQLLCNVCVINRLNYIPANPRLNRGFAGILMRNRLRNNNDKQGGGDSQYPVFSEIVNHEQFRSC